MIETQRYPKRLPAVRCWIKHLLEGKYVEMEKIIFTIFGKVKRVRILATIIDKREIMNPQSDNNSMGSEEDDSSNLRVEFDLDDSTGIIRAILWQVNPEKYLDFIKGDIVDIVGLIRRWKEFISISPEIIKKVKNPNIKLLRNAEIIKKIKSGEIQEIPEINEEDFKIDEISSEIDVNYLFENEDPVHIIDKKEEIYTIVKKYSLEGKGINFNELKEILQIPEDLIKKYIKDLEMESRIYASEQNIYHSY